MQELGYNYRIPDMNCALGLSQLARADEGLARRRQLAARYDAAFAQLPGVTVLAPGRPATPTTSTSLKWPTGKASTTS